MTIDYKVLDTIAKQEGTSFYLFYPEIFVKNLNDFSKLLATYYKNSKVAYAYKANYMPILGQYLKQNDCWGEVVSGMEYDIARIFLAGEHLIFNGPCKTAPEMNRALEDGAVLNLDSFYELDLLRSLLDHHKNISVGLRVSFDIGTGSSRFGFNYENGEFMRAVSSLLDMGKVKLTSIHSHFTTRERSLDLFERRVNGMLDVYDAIPCKEQIQHLNIGGGFFGPISEEAKKNFTVAPPSFEDYASLIGNAFNKRFGEDGPTLFVEPGVSMIANAMDFVVQVLDSREVKGRRILTVDGSVNNLFPTGSKYNPDFNIICAEKRERIRSDIAGYTCMEHDILMADIDIAAAPGDFIAFHNRGAYSNVYKPPFIKSAPAIVGIDGEVFSRRQTFEDVIATYVGSNG